MPIGQTDPASGERPRPGTENETERQAYAEASPLSRLRLLTALDALLVEQSVGRAADRMGLGAPAMSRLLKQIREIYGDPILRKTGRGMAPTPFAEQLRLRIRALVEEASDLLQVQVPDTPKRGTKGINRLPLTAAPALSLAPVIDIGGPTPRQFAAKLNAIGPRAEPRQRLAKAIATIGAGAGRSRPLTMQEAEEAFGHILAGRADPIQVGAFLAILQFRNATASELAGMALALREHIGVPRKPGGETQLDWPAYLSPKAPLQPWFLMAAKLVSNSGADVLVHGGTGLAAEGLEAAAEFLGIRAASGIDDAGSTLSEHGIAFLPFSILSDQLTALIGLYRLFEMRSPLNQAVHLINPLNAPTLMLGALQSSHKDLAREAAGLLGWEHLSVTSNNRDVAEVTSLRSTTILRSIAGAPSEIFLPASKGDRTGRPAELSSFEYWQAIWRGQARDEQPIRKVIDTTTLALMTLRNAPRAEWSNLHREASRLWLDRH
ncbi:MAG TPA: glycosyl transferase family protein [Rhizobiaceae bacterium]|nr:glycosyl transferase family protein [Rhizobiaceae bacterium]